VPSPLAHGGVALALRLFLSGPWAPPAWASRLGPPGRLLDRVALVAAFASIAPDLDLLGGIGWHRGPTHSLVGAALLGAGIAVAAGLRGRDALAVTLACVLHVPMDFSTGEPGAPSRYGVPWLWPFSPHKAIATDPWFGAFHIDEPGFLAHMLHPRAAPVYAKEAATAALCVAAAATLRAIRGSSPPPARDPAL
jgi:hypothetical protein